MPLPTHTTVIGAGSLGLFTALWLARRGEQVTVVDKGTPMREASGVNAGSLGVQNKLLPLVPITIAALEHWEAARELVGDDVGFRRIGGIRVATDEREVALLRKGFEGQLAAGVELEWLEGAAVRERAPFLSSEVKAASYCPADCVADPLRLAPALLKTVQALGVTLRGATEAREIKRRGDGYSVRTDEGEFVSKRLLVAAGAWSQPLCAQLGLHIPVALDVNIVAVTEPRPRAMKEVVTHARGILTLKQVANGTFLIGGGWQGDGDLKSGRKGVAYESALHNIRLATRVVPELKPAMLVRQWAGFEGVSPDSLPYAGPIPGADNAYVLTCARGGWSISPEIGRLMSGLMLDGRAEESLERFRPERFAHG
jgi:sarcosine oxidase, subunit beta